MGNIISFICPCLFREDKVEDKPVFDRQTDWGNDELQTQIKYYSMLHRHDGVCVR